MNTPVQPGRSVARLSIAIAAAAAAAFPGLSVRAQFAAAVTQYEPGIGFATEFATGAGYTNTAAILGEPSRNTPGLFGGPVDPFAPPYLRDQLLSLGAGGSVTLRLDVPLDDNPLHPYGLDFQLYGGAGFIIVNGDYSGGGITDGSVFGGATGLTRVSVSRDGETFYVLDPARAPAPDGVNPTDGSGAFGVPVDPSLRGPDFVGLGLAGIRLAYHGSAGGAGYDLSWAQDAGGQPVSVTQAGYVRIEVLTGRAELDAIAGVAAVPEPGTWGLLGAGGLLLAGWRLAAGRGSRSAGTTE